MYERGKVGRVLKFPHTASSRCACSVINVYCANSLSVDSLMHWAGRALTIPMYDVPSAYTGAALGISPRAGPEHETRVRGSVGCGDADRHHDNQWRRLATPGHAYPEDLPPSMVWKSSQGTDRHTTPAAGRHSTTPRYIMIIVHQPTAVLPRGSLWK